ncbi:hypothetical protein P9A14_08520 [Gordonia hongkongensis]|uniref:Uncharacterized protein n=2 Tax=Gordonia TaxID=2053 RepID=A0AAX3TBC0_9ACTN|nr:MULTISPECIES: hypothetical protein [Gordonia]OCW87085.1 hypothetical protein A8M60_18655 [Nocardia farcinica]QIK48597.1 hypothetical protein G8C36_16220 [Gordonia terrae]MBN0971261.1 hypothetical protein [Gordonia sp. BP-119]MBN0983678.1 hypothetical protein [Gordonia sp. BP-94]MCX2752708.1 hypothetical protein [Gordonia sp. 4N]
MSYQDPRDPRTARYESGYTPESRAYSSQNDPYARDPYAADPYAGDPYGGQGAYGRPGQPAKPRRGPDINPVTFAGGVVMTGVVTGLAAWLVAWIISAFVEKVNESGKFGVWNPVAASELWFGVVGFLCALAAGALWYVLHLVTPSPDQFYRWIVGLLLVAAVLIPILTYNQISVGIETAIVHLVIGLPSLTIIPAMAGKSVQRPAG